MKCLLVFFAILFFFKCHVRCDLPVNCSYPEVVGKWLFHLEAGDQSYGYQCNDHTVTPVSTLQIDLTFPNVAVDQAGNVGTWTLVYNQGFEVVMQERRYFAFFQYKQISSDAYVSICNMTTNGWFHDNVDLSKPSFPVKNWGCYFGLKIIGDENLEEKQPKFTRVPKRPSYLENLRYGLKEEFVDQINTHQSEWRAAVYPQFENKTIGEIVRMAGGPKMVVPNVKPREVTPEMLEMVKDLPEAFDWRNKSGESYVTPIRNQGNCGSCYAFASMAAIECGVSIATNNRISPVLSPQYVVSCSNYSQGCDGGFPYLIAGRFAQDYGVVTENTYPYIGKTTVCKDRFVDQGNRVFVYDYGYVGGFYGGCNEVLMRATLVKIGPIVVGINVTSDFIAYKGGIYSSTGLKDLSLGDFNPYEVTNHAVLVVGYGVSHDTGTKYWVVKNSWGANWGEQGYFRIRRGFPYLVAGKFAQDYGVILEGDYPYTGEQTVCKDRFTSKDNRYFVTDYGYVGGFYGGCNEILMQVALTKVGPLAVSFNVTQDFMHYKGGIYSTTGLSDSVHEHFNPFEVTNHVVVVVGYGVSHDTGTKYWVVKNSWGTDWGEEGYFRIRRGTDELGLESLAVYIKPFVNNH